MYGATDVVPAAVSPGQAPVEEVARRRSLGSRPPEGVQSRARFTRSINKVVKIQKVTHVFENGRQQRRESSTGLPVPGSPEPIPAASPVRSRSPAPAPSSELPTAWSDLSHDVAGVRNLVIDGKWVFIPLVITTVLALIAIFSRQGPVVVFAFAFLGLLPLAMQLGDLTEMLSGWCGPVAGGLINATLGNATELIVGISAIRHGLVGIEQGALLGGVLSNMLFVLGLSFLLGGIATQGAQTFDIRTTTADIGVLFIACLGVVLPTAFGIARGQPGPAQEAAILSDSRATAAILFLMYAAYLLFTLWPMDPFTPPPPSAKRSHGKLGSGGGAADAGAAGAADMEAPLLPKVLEEQDEQVKGHDVAAGNEDEEEGPPTISAVTLVGLLACVTVLVAIYSNALVTSVFPVSAILGIPADFIAVVLIPIVGNVAELATAVMAARHDKMDLTIAVALGSATQIALFLVPAAVMFGWAIDVPMSLDFSPTFALAFFGAVIAVGLLVMDGESHWLKGTLLLGGYGIIVMGMALNNGAAGVGPTSPGAASGPLSAPAT